MANDNIDHHIFLNIFNIRKKNNRADLDSIYKEIVKSLVFEHVTKEFLDDRIHTSINDGKIINKINRNADSYYVNSELIDLETLNLPNFSPDMQGITPTATISLSNTTENTPQVNQNQTPQLPKSGNLPNISNNSKSKCTGKLNIQEENTDTENLRAEFIALKSFVIDQIYMFKKRSNEKDNGDLIKSLFDQIEFLKQELKSKDTIIKMILENYNYNLNHKPLPVTNIYKQISNKNNDEFIVPKKTFKNKLLNEIPEPIYSPNRFDALRTQNNDKDNESEHLNLNETVSHLPKNAQPKAKSKAPTTVIFGDSIVKNVYGKAITKRVKHRKHVVVKHFSGVKIDDRKHYVKPTQKTQPAQIIVHIGTNDFSSNRNSDEIAKSIKTDKNNIVISSILPRKDGLNNKVIEVNLHLKEKCEANNLSLIEHHNINPYRHINAKGLHLNNYGDNQLTKTFTRFIGNG